jgi:uncharacterized ion transporter superfamily protein YfcC
VAADAGRGAGVQIHRRMRLRLPHPVLLLLAAILAAAALTWVLPAGEYDRRDDEATGRRVVVAGTYHRVPASPVGPLGAAMSVPRGFIEGAEVVVVVLLVGGAFVVVDRLGTLRRLVGAMVRRSRRRGLWAIPAVAFFFAVMGALENMQEEIIPLIPVLLLLGRGLGVDALTVVGMSAGAAMIGSAFGPINPFQAAIALKLAELPALSLAGLRAAMFAVGFVLWLLWTMRHAVRTRVPPMVDEHESLESLDLRHAGILALILAPLAAYVIGVMQLGWGFNELSAVFLVGGVSAGLLGGLGATGTTLAYLEGMQSMLPAATMIALARSISLVLADGRVIDTILNGLATPLGELPGVMTALLMVPVQALVHVVVPSVSGQAALTMPVMVPLMDVLGQSRQLAVLSYQTGAGLMELLTPTNGALMAVLLAAGVPFGRWFRFALGGALLALMVGVAAIVIVAASG